MTYTIEQLNENEEANDDFLGTYLQADTPPTEIFGKPFKIIEQKSYINMETFDTESGSYDKITEYIIQIGDEFFLYKTEYNSWEGPSGEIKQVYPKQKTITVYE